MECPHCHQHLEYTDRYGRFAKNQDGKTLGEIWRCTNEKCIKYADFFYTKPSGELKEGYPC